MARCTSGRQVRLHHARSLMLTEGLGASDASYRVGDNSPSQFSRDFRRMFGHAPSRAADAPFYEWPSAV